MSVILVFYAAIGLGLGVVADKVLQTKSVGLIMNLLLGAAGAVAGAWIVGTLSFTSADDRMTASVIASVLFSLLALFLGFLFKRY